MARNWIVTVVLFFTATTGILAQNLSPQNAPRIAQITVMNPAAGNSAGQCVANASNSANPNDFQPGQRVLVISGVNFTTGPFASLPVLYVGDERIGTPLDNPAIAATDSQILYAFDCSDLNTVTGLRRYTSNTIKRVAVYTGNGSPFVAELAFNYAVRGANGNDGLQGPQGPKGDKGDQGSKGDKGDQGNQGPKGDPGSQGSKGDPGANGNDGAQGPKGDKGDPGSQGSQGAQGPKGDQGNQGLKGDKGDPGAKGDKGDAGVQGPQGNVGPQGAQGSQGPQGPQGTPGAQGPQGPRGIAAGYYRSVTTASINTTPQTVLTATLTGSVAYVVNAKLNVPFGNNAKTVTCTLEAVENGSSTVFDRADHLLIGSASTTAKGVIALDGFYSAIGGRTANVTVNVNCFTGGDSRTINNGTMNAIGLDSAN